MPETSVMSVLSQLLMLVFQAAVAAGVPTALWQYMRQRDTQNREMLLTRVRNAADVAAGDAYRTMVLHASLPTQDKLALGQDVGKAYLARAIPDTLAALLKFGERPDIEAMIRARIGQLLAADPTVSAFRAPDPAPVVQVEPAVMAHEPEPMPSTEVDRAAEEFKKMVAPAPALNLGQFSVR